MPTLPITLMHHVSFPSWLRAVRFAAVATTAIFLAAPSLLRAQQTLFVSSGGQTIAQVSSTGAVSTFATLANNTNPRGLAFDGGGNLYVAGGSSNRIDRISPGGGVSPFATLSSPAEAGPVGLTFDGTSNLYVASTINSRISRISPAGTVSAFASVNPGYTLNGLAFDTQGNLYAAAGNSNQISRISPTGAVSLFATVPASNAQFPNGVQGLAFDGVGNLYVSDYDSSRIFRINPAGITNLFATLPANSGPEGLAFDAQGNLYVANYGSNQISRISPDGLTVSVYASGVSAPAYLAFGAVPEPSTWALVFLGATVTAALASNRWMKKVG